MSAVLGRAIQVTIAGRELTFVTLPKQLQGEVQVRIGESSIQEIGYRREDHGILLYFTDRVVFVDLAQRAGEDGTSQYEVSSGAVAPDRALVGVVKGLSVKRAGEKEAEAQGVKKKRALRLKAQMPGKVVRISVVEGQSVAAGEGLLVLEAMKMENEIKAPDGGVVRKVSVQAGSAVESGAELIVIE